MQHTGLQVREHELRVSVDLSHRKKVMMRNMYRVESFLKMKGVAEKSANLVWCPGKGRGSRAACLRRSLTCLSWRTGTQCFCKKFQSEMSRLILRPWRPLGRPQAGAQFLLSFGHGHRNSLSLDAARGRAGGSLFLGFVRTVMWTMFWIRGVRW